MQKILIIGATSAIAEAFARRLAARGACITLVGRDAMRLGAIQSDLIVRGAQAVHCIPIDVDDFSRHSIVVHQAYASMGGFDVALLAHGTLPDQQRCDESTDFAMRHFTTNATATIALMTEIALAMRGQQRGTIAVVSSVAGDRGRASNALYGSAKAAVTAFASGLRQRLNASGINVLTIKPGFVDTPMTANFRKGPLWASPADIALGIDHAIARRRSVAYLPWFWYPIMGVIRLVPETVFRRVKL